LCQFNFEIGEKMLTCTGVYHYSNAHASCINTCNTPSQVINVM